MRIVFSLIFSFVLLFSSHAQRKQGTWQDYLSYANANAVAAADTKIFCATTGGLFYFDREDNSINKYSNLSDFGIKTIAYNNDNQVLVVAYTNSNIDLIYGSQVVNLSDIKRKSIIGDKTINKISFNNNEAFLSCGFGIVVINLEKNEIKDTYYIGEGGAALAVNDVEIFGEFIYAATDEGILKAPVEGVNLLDYSNWEKDETIPNSSEQFTQLAMHSGNLLANYSDNGNDEIFSWNGSTWTSYYTQLQVVNDLSVAENHLLVTNQNELIIFDSQNILIGKINAYNFSNGTVDSIEPKGATITADGTIWIADIKNALVKYSSEKFEKIYPEGPENNDVFYVNAENSDVWITAGGHTDTWGNAWNAASFRRYNSGNWTNFSIAEIPQLEDIPDLVNMAIDPTDDQHFFVGSWGGGVLEFRNDEFVARYNNQNSPLESALPMQPDEPYVRIGGLDFDTEGNLWIVNSESSNNLHKLTPSGDWESFELEEIESNTTVGQVVVTQNNDKWIVVPRGNDAYVIDKTGELGKRLLVTAYFSNGSDEFFTRLNDVYSIVEDNEGAIWMGTSKGVVVYNNPSRIWSAETFYGVQPGLDLNDGIYHPLLETETVTAIAVDGANRKWFGTKNSGVFLISENGEEEIEHFTSENSALLSNSILDITVNQKNGEVFFGTDIGLISYQGESTGGNSNYDNVYVYPNPVRETYTGSVTIAGLIENSDIKITDITGNLVFKTTSLGGQAIWDGNNRNGNRVKTGVYLVFCNDENGEETHITKLLFIN